MRLALLLLLLLAACDSPAPQMLGGQELKVTRGGRDYAVYLKGRMAEVIRFGWADRAELPAIRAQMLALIPEVTGCVPMPSTLQGDSGEIRARLECRRKTEPHLAEPG